MDQVKIGGFIAALRREKEWTQEELGERLGVTNKTISRWETGRYMPDIEMLTLLGRELDVSLNELIQGQRLETEDTFRAAADENLASAMKRPFLRFWKWLDRNYLSVFIILALVMLLVSVCVMHADYRREHPIDATLRGTFITGTFPNQVYLTFNDFSLDGDTFVLHLQGEILSYGSYVRYGETVTLSAADGTESTLLIKGNRLYVPTEDAGFIVYEKRSDTPWYMCIDREDLDFGVQQSPVSVAPSQWPYFSPPAQPTFIN